MKHQTFLEDIYGAVFYGLCRYLGPLKLALVVAEKGQDKTLNTLDPDHLLSSAGIGAGTLRQFAAEGHKRPLGGPLESKNLLIYTDHEDSDPKLLWILEKPPTLQNSEPIEQWLSETITLTRIARGNRPISAESARSACDTLLSFAPSAVRRAIQSKTKTYRVINPLDVILSLTLAYEEGKKCTGSITFHDGAQLPTHCLSVTLRDGMRPRLTATKHLRKLMTSVENTRFSILANHVEAVGIFDMHAHEMDVRNLVDQCVSASFTKGRADICVGTQYVCSAYEGQLFSRSAAPSELAINQLLRMPSLLSASEVQVLTAALAKLVQHVQGSGSGCSLVINADPKLRELAGDYLDPPLDLTGSEGLEIASRMAKIDGALCITGACHLIAFGCLLDGKHTPEEDRARGGRYNSAIRFTHSNPQCLVITVSSDGPISCFYRGRDVNNARQLILPPTSFMQLT